METKFKPLYPWPHKAPAFKDHYAQKWWANTTTKFPRFDWQPPSISAIKPMIAHATWKANVPTYAYAVRKEI